MTLDLESLRLVIAVLDLALAELAARRIIEAVIHQHTAGVYNEQ